jgi:cobalt-zinc-cadmium efflux system membrane fusion protein
MIAVSCNTTQNQATDSHAEDSHEGHDHGDHEHDPTAEVVLTTMQMEKIGLELGKREERDLHSRLKVNGVVKVLPTHQAQASALLAGRVTSIRVKPGDFVKRGTPLAYLQNPDLIDIKQELKETEGSLYYLNKEFVRQQSLLKDKVIAEEQFQRITSDRQQAQATKAGLEAKLKAFGISPSDSTFRDVIAITSPISGYVDEIMVSIGAYVEPMQILFSILDNRQPYLELKVFEQDIQWVKQGQLISFFRLNHPTEKMEARIFSIDKMLESSDRSLKALASIDKPAASLLPGMYIEAGISQGSKKRICLPEEAIALDKQLPYIFIKMEELEGEIHFQKVEVLLGLKDDGFVEVDPMQELVADAEVVVKGAYYLMAQSKKGESVPGHSH